MSEPMFVDGRVVGQLDFGVFFQRISTRHIYRAMNAKGMDVNLHRALRGKCWKWRLEFEDTKRVIEIDYDRIEISGKLIPVVGVGLQWMVRLDLFDELMPATQRRMI